MNDSTTLDKLSDVVRRGQEAREAAKVLEPILAYRANQIVAEAVGAFRGAKLDPTRAVAYIAAMSEVSALREELDHRIRQGEKAGRELFGEPQKQ